MHSSVCLLRVAAEVVAEMDRASQWRAPDKTRCDGGRSRRDEFPDWTGALRNGVSPISAAVQPLVTGPVTQRMTGLEAAATSACCRGHKSGGRLRPPQKKCAKIRRKMQLGHKTNNIVETGGRRSGVLMASACPKCDWLVGGRQGPRASVKFLPRRRRWRRPDWVGPR